jgi:hypothetical protein
METMKRILNLAVAFVIASAPVLAQEVSFRATVDRNEISVGDGVRDSRWNSAMLLPAGLQRRTGAAWWWRKALPPATVSAT